MLTKKEVYAEHTFSINFFIISFNNYFLGGNAKATASCSKCPL